MQETVGAILCITRAWKSQNRQSKLDGERMCPVLQLGESHLDETSAFDSHTLFISSISLFAAYSEGLLERDQTAKEWLSLGLLLLAILTLHLQSAIISVTAVHRMDGWLHGQECTQITSLLKMIPAHTLQKELQKR